jgi:hypothetical protein
LVFIYLLNEKIKHGPEGDGDVTPYRNLHIVADEIPENIKQSVEV